MGGDWGHRALRPGLGMNIETNCFVGTASGARQPPATSPALSFTIYSRRKYFVSTLWLAAWPRSPGGHKTQLWKINGGVRMFQWAISLFITISPCPVSRGPDPNIVSGTWDSSHQSDMHIAHWALWSSLVLTLSPCLHRHNIQRRRQLVLWPN